MLARKRATWERGSAQDEGLPRLDTTNTRGRPPFPKDAVVAVLCRVLPVSPASLRPHILRTGGFCTTKNKVYIGDCGWSWWACSNVKM